MKTLSSKKPKRLVKVLHRDFGFFFSGLIIIYCISGLALNHIDDWNPDFVIEKKRVEIPQIIMNKKISRDQVIEFGKKVGEVNYKLYDFPTPAQVKIYYDNASLLIDLTSGSGIYERVLRRPIFYQSNILHRNSLKGWKWAADVFAVMLIAISVTGLLIFRGKNGISGRGKWLIIAGMLPPVMAWTIYELVQK